MYFLRITKTIGFLAAILPNFLFAAESGGLLEQPLVLTKPPAAISEKAGNYLLGQNRDKVRIWVFFLDKKIYDEAGFRQAAAQIAVNEHAKARRQKMGLRGITFADLPVNKDYIEQIINEGATLRRVSRWLNAASFEVPISLIEKLAALSCVGRIEPVASFKADMPPVSETPVPLRLEKPGDITGLNYGISYAQVNMINAPAMHNMGYKGQDVIVAMLDTGYRKSHQAFAQAYRSGRVLAEYDFIFNDSNTDNEPGDIANQHDHGTETWSTLGGSYSGQIFGPAYGASFLLAKTEDMRSETPVEEDNWVAAMEWADSLGADVISSSLGYSDWYTYADFNGNTAVTTKAANLAAGLGIIVCNSMGNAGPNPGTLTPPADAFDILACGAVDASKYIAGFSSRGPTYDGRIKPEVCAMGVADYVATANTDNGYSYGSGTSFAAPLVAGSAALILSANPSLTPLQIRKSFMLTASQAQNPDNNYGWGIIDALAAYNWGANFTADSTLGYGDLNVNFTDISNPPATGWKWYFGDGDSSALQNPTHYYDAPGSYDVTLIIESSEGTLNRTRKELISVVADTLTFATDSAYSGYTAVMPVVLKNTQKLNSIIIPVSYPPGTGLIFDSMSFGSRTSNFEALRVLYQNDSMHQLVFELIADTGGGTPRLAPGNGEIARLYFDLDRYAPPGVLTSVDTSEVDGKIINLANAWVQYGPAVVGGNIIARYVKRGDANNNGLINMQDITYLIAALYFGGPSPVTIRAGDAFSDNKLNLHDIGYLINYLYRGGPPPED
jgi:subtilisin family serine protease